jgi:hypothetical protein
MSDPSSKAVYRWPWFVLAGVILGVLLAAVWMYQEVKRAKRIQELNASPSLPSANPPK